MADHEATPNTPDAIVICCAPDVCLAPDRPVPFQIVARFSDAESHSDDVRFRGHHATTMRTRLTRVMGDERGTGGGLDSRVFGGYCRPTEAAARSVRVNGCYVLRHDTEFDMNCDGPEGIANTTGRAVFQMETTVSTASDGSISGDTNPPIEPQTPEEQSFRDAVQSGELDQWLADRWKGALTDVKERARGLSAFDLDEAKRSLGRWSEEQLLQYRQGVEVGARDLAGDIGGAAQLAGDLLAGDLGDQAPEVLDALGVPPLSQKRGVESLLDGAAGVIGAMQDPGALARGLFEPFAEAFGAGGLAGLLGFGSVDIAGGGVARGLGVLRKLRRTSKLVDGSRMADVAADRPKVSTSEPGIRITKRQIRARRYDEVTEWMMRRHDLTPDTKLYRSMDRSYLDQKSGTVMGNPNSSAKVNDWYDPEENQVYRTMVDDYGPDAAKGVSPTRAREVNARDIGPGLNVSRERGAYSGDAIIEIRLGDALDRNGKVFRDISSNAQGSSPFYVTFEGAIPYREVGD